jgi:undecaprenyl pyrophosphate phosphatase UppP
MLFLASSIGVGVCIAVIVSYLIVALIKRFIKKKHKTIV